MFATDISISRRLLAITVVSCLLIGFAGQQALAYYAQLLGGPIWSPGQAYAVCYLFNPWRGENLSVASAILGEPDSESAIVGNTCEGHFNICYVVANITSGAHACFFEINYDRYYNDFPLSGAMEIRGADSKILNSVGLQFNLEP